MKVVRTPKIPQGVAQKVICDTVRLVLQTHRSWSSYDFMISLGFLRGIIVSLVLRMHNFVGFRTPKHMIISIGGSLWPAFIGFLPRLIAADSVFVCFTTAERDFLRTRLGLERVHFVPYGIDTASWKPSTIHENYVFSGGKTARDYSTLFSAIKSIEYRFVIALDRDPLTGKLGFKQEEVPTNAQIFIGVTVERFKELLSRAQFVVLPMKDTKHSAGHTVLVQAMASGEAIISSRVRGTKDYIINGINGFLVAPGDVAGLKEKIEFLLSHAELRSIMSSNARAIAVAEYDESKLAKRLASILMSMSVDK